MDQNINPGSKNTLTSFSKYNFIFPEYDEYIYIAKEMKEKNKKIAIKKYKSSFETFLSKNIRRTEQKNNKIFHRLYVNCEIINLCLILNSAAK